MLNYKYNISYLFITLFITGCSSTPVKQKNIEEVNAKYGIKCQESISPLTQKKYQVCVERKMFQPAKWHFLADENVLFRGTDDGRIYFSGSLKGDSNLIEGRCFPKISIVGTNQLPLSKNSIPPRINNACEIKFNKNNASLPFLATSACQEAISEERFSSLGGKVPLQHGTRCFVIENNSKVFDKYFIAPK